MNKEEFNISNDTLYLVVGIKHDFNPPSVKIYGIYNNIKDAEKRQLVLCDNKIISEYAHSDIIQGINGFTSWIHELKINNDCKITCENPSRILK